MNHLDDDAELYALGLTDASDAAAIEAHLADCADCRERVARAEQAAASLAAALPAAPLRRSTSPWWAGLASAAALVCAATAAIEGAAAQSASAQLQRTDVALVAIASSHFGHTTLTAQPGVIAKAMYARDGAWCYVVATGAPRNAHLVMHRGAEARDMGALDPGAPATLFVRAPGRADEITIVAGGELVAHGTPAY